MWQASVWVAWVVSVVVFVWMAVDFFKINVSFGEDKLLSSREGVDELFSENNPSKGA